MPRVSPDAIEYPRSPRSDHADIIHDVRVPDPFRWLEDIDSEQTRDWIKEQNRITFEYLEWILAREKIRRRITDLWSHERFGVPFKRGE